MLKDAVPVHFSFPIESQNFRQKLNSIKFRNKYKIIIPFLSPAIFLYGLLLYIPFLCMYIATKWKGLRNSKICRTAEF